MEGGDGVEFDARVYDGVADLVWCCVGRGIEYDALFDYAVRSCLGY